MKATFYSNTKPLGTIDMKTIDQSMGVVGGRLTPNAAYFELQPFFRRSKGQYNNEIEQLTLNIQLENGCFLQPAGGFSIMDTTVFPDEITIEIVGSNYFMIFDTLDDGPPSTFLTAPWHPLSIETKIALEDEVRRKVRSFGGNNLLAQHQYFALADFGPEDDVLCYVTGKNEYSFAVVHLTWTTNPDNSPSYPAIEFYRDFEDFKKARMIPTSKGRE
ncbi:hypothetical protein HF324_09760 [Chitinophaga oryzae]|uniref:Uncharacterized protein n=1 Tax=Chitinophaga oryzae TaxID=2725414 RepID=A0AAE6ZET1_9BACT|nr:hypothetical protein [Chitinophaga oryzae]QJB31643.1 hypothetical protein HF329_10100 [Chitinophaga oryzae]QJB38127.1 hypothetical protein HF324_09760 [Chitinophaga oryzae]